LDTVSRTSGIEWSSERKLEPVMAMSTIGDVAVTVAVRRSSRMSAISPKKSPASSFATARAAGDLRRP
jgi:hypothetical protein